MFSCSGESKKKPSHFPICLQTSCCKLNYPRTMTTKWGQWHEAVANNNDNNNNLD